MEIQVWAKTVCYVIHVQILCILNIRDVFLIKKQSIFIHIYSAIQKKTCNKMIFNNLTAFAFVSTEVSKPFL